MKREVFDCDSCKTENVDCIKLQVYIGSTFNGVDRDETYLNSDVCMRCCERYLNDMFGRHSAEANREKLKALGIPVTAQYLR